MHGQELSRGADDVALGPAQVHEIATGIWSDRLLNGQQTTVALGDAVFRSAAGSEATNVAGDS